MNALDRTIILVSAVLASMIMIAMIMMMVAIPLQQQQTNAWQVQQQQTSLDLYCDCPGGACVSGSWPCPSDYGYNNDDGSYGLNGWEV